MKIADIQAAQTLIMFDREWRCVWRQSRRERLQPNGTESRIAAWRHFFKSDPPDLFRAYEWVDLGEADAYCFSDAMIIIAWEETSFWANNAKELT